LRLLIVTDSEALFALLRTLLRAGAPSLRVTHADGPLTLARQVRDGGFGAAIVDHELRWSRPAEVIGLLRESDSLLPVLVLTTPDDPRSAAEALTEGASAVLAKDPEGFQGVGVALAAALEGAEERRRLGRLEARLHTLLDQSGLGFFRATVDGELLEVNQALLDLLGASALQELRELDLPAPSFRRRQRSELLRVLDEGRAVHRRELDLPTPAGPRAVSLTERLCLDHQGELVVDGLVVDLSARQLAERALAERARQLQRSNQDLQRFAYVASHELQEPLRGIVHFAALLEEEEANALGPEGLESLRFIRQGAERMQTLVDDLLAFSRGESRGGAPRPVACDEVVREALEQLAPAVEESAARVHLRPLPVVAADRSQLLLLFRNLLSNALKFRSDRPPEITVSARQLQGVWELAVEDNGIGIEPEHREEIFAVFRRLHHELPGSGIGLAVCKKIVERHGGRIWAESVPGEGSVLRFTLAGQAGDAQPDPSSLTAAGGVEGPEERTP
jgi:signal transduction histidine kinase